MPEVPDLEAIRSFFNRHIVGQTVTRVETPIPFLVRVPRDDFVRLLTGDTFGEVHRYGKFLLFSLESGRVLVVNPMLTGRFAYVEPKARKRARTGLILALANGCEIRYADHLRMGRIYLTTPDQLNTLPQFPDMGPDVLDPALTEDAFKQRLLHHRGQVKGILTNHRFVAGIGNAYSDEILWEARLHPYRKRTQLSEDEMSALYRAVHSVLAWATAIVTEKMRDSIDYAEWRDHLRVHRRGGEPCPRRGAAISEITAGQRVTSFCRRCQP